MNRHARAFVLAAVVAAASACTGPTEPAPAPIKAVPVVAFDGDDDCGDRGWVLVNGAKVCNP